VVVEEAVICQKERTEKTYKVVEKPKILEEAQFAILKLSDGFHHALAKMPQ
jgi:hypothetical protein